MSGADKSGTTNSGSGSAGQQSSEDGSGTNNSGSANKFGGSEAGSNIDGEDQAMNSIAKAINKARKKKEVERVCAMCTAAWKGSLSELKALFAGADISINQGDYDLRTPLHLAASEGHMALVEWLLEIGADTTVKDRYDSTPMADAVRHKHDDIVGRLREHGDALEHADAASLLCFAASRGDVEQLRRLIESRVNPNVADYDGRTAMSLAASEGHINCIEYLLSQFAEVNPVDRWDGTPLTDAIRHKHIQVQELLREHGAKLSASTDEAGLLCEYAAKGNTEQLHELVRNGVDVNLGDYDERCALHLACCEGQLGTIEYLLSCKNIDVNVVDRLGGTPLEDAVREKKDPVIALLTTHGGVRAKSPGLEDRIKARDQRAVKRKQDKVAATKADIALHERERLVQSEMTRLAEDSEKMLRSLHTLLDALSLTLHSRGARTAKALKLSPKPTLNETLESFREAFGAFARRHHVNNLLECFNSCRHFVSRPERDQLFTLHEQFIAPGARHMLNLPPKLRKIISDALERRDGPMVPEVVKGVLEFLEAQLATHLQKFHRAREFRVEFISPHGRLWRVLMLAREASDTTRKLEDSVLKPLVALAGDETLAKLFDGSATVSEQLGATVFKLSKECADVRDLLRRSAAGVKVLYELSQHRKIMIGGNNPKEKATGKGDLDDGGDDADAPPGKRKDGRRISLKDQKKNAAATTHSSNNGSSAGIGSDDGSI